MAATQDALFAVEVPTPDLGTYDLIVANISGGKDSQTMLRQLVHAAEAAGVRHRIVCVFADLGEDEWAGAPALAAEHAAAYGLRFITVCKMIVDPVTGEKRQQSLLEYIEHRGMWPDARNRYCTSDLKRGPIGTVVTALVRELREAWRSAAGGAKALPRRVRVLNVMGMRAQESTKRRLMHPFTYDEPASNGRRHVDEWLPIHAWTADEVWADIRASGVRYHPVYDMGMPRLSCMFCVLASESALIRAAQLNPAGAAKRAELEIRMGHTFQNGRSMASIIAKAQRLPAPAAIEDWAA